MTNTTRSNGGESVKSSPTKAKEEKRPGSGQAGKGMGVKQMEDQVSTLHKQNFDLKLELYHRRQRQEVLEVQLDEKTKQLEELEETRVVNDQLLAELERRDQALDEAVGVIVNLEEKIERMIKEREMVRSVEENPYRLSTELSTTTPNTPLIREGTAKKTVVRMPSFLSERSEHTEVLRSMYLPRQHTLSEASLAHLPEEDSPDIMNSPRLSVLSESSFLSVYGDKLDLNASPEVEQRPRADSTIDQWVEAQPPTQHRRTPSLSQQKQFLSINDVLESPLQRLEKLRATLEKASGITLTVPVTVPERSSSVVHHNKRKDRMVKPIVVDKKSFDRQQSLPPTPDTFSTNTLHRNQASDDTLAQRNGIFTNFSSMNTDIHRNIHDLKNSSRPRSAGETITSRREGHGWDTETQADTIDNESIISEASTFAPSSFQPLSPRVRRVRTPDLFNFSSSENSGNWARDVLFNNHSSSVGRGHEEMDLPPLNHKRVLRARRSSVSEGKHFRSDDTVAQYSAKYGHENMSGLETPNRRSSLVGKGMKIAPSPSTSRQVENSTIASTPQQQAVSPTMSRTTRLASKLFGRHPSSSSTPQTNTISPESTQQQQNQRPSHLQRTPSSQHYPSVLDTLQSNLNSQEDLDSTCATPPPIRRSKTSQPQNSISVGRSRPASAGQGSASGGVRVKRMSGYYEDVNAGFQEGREEIFGKERGIERSAGNSGGQRQGKERKGSLSIDIGVARGLGALLGGSGSGNGGGNGASQSAIEDGDGEGRRKWLGLRRH